MLTITINGANDAPTLTTMAAAVDTVAEDTQVEITFAEIAAQGNEADVDGTVNAFVVKAVSSGTLLIGRARARRRHGMRSPTTRLMRPTGVLDRARQCQRDAECVHGGGQGQRRSGVGSAPVQVQVMSVTAVNDAPIMDLNGAAPGSDNSTPYTVEDCSY